LKLLLTENLAFLSHSEHQKWHVLRDRKHSLKAHFSEDWKELPNRCFTKSLMKYGEIISRPKFGFGNVVLQLVVLNASPCLLYAIEACPVNKTQESSLEFTTNHTNVMKS